MNGLFTTGRGQRLLDLSELHVIAEPGSTCEGDLERMRFLMCLAADFGATAFKNQWVSDAMRLCERRSADPDRYLASYRMLAYPVEWHRQLRALAHSFGLSYGCTVYLPVDASMLAGAVDFLKIASFERQDKELRRASMELGVSVIQSHGLGGQPDYYCEQLVHLRCVSAYPAPLQSLRLRLIRSRRSGWYHGLSDHSKDVRTGGWAVAAGATVLEVHLAHPSAGADNLDLACALQPAEFAEYVKNARDAWTACTGTTMDQSEAESPMLPYLVPR